MTPQQTIDNIVVYSALHNGVLDSSVKVLDKSVKALEIIKNKKVDVSWLDICESRNEYNCIKIEKLHLTQDEYDLLKGELK